MRCRWFWPFFTIAFITIGAIIFSKLSGLIVLRWFFQFKDRCLAMILWETLKTACFTTCSNSRQTHVLVLWGYKNNKTKEKQCLGRLNIFLGLIKTLWRHYICQNLWLDFLTSALGTNKGRQITTIVKDWWFSMSQSQSVRSFLLNHWDRLFSHGFQIKNNR